MYDFHDWTLFPYNFPNTSTLQYVSTLQTFVQILFWCLHRPYFIYLLMYLSVDWLWVGSVFGVSIDSISVYICLHNLYGYTLIFLEYMTEKELPIHMKTLCSTFQGSASLLGWQFTITLELAIGFWLFCVFINTCYCLHF